MNLEFRDYRPGDYEALHRMIRQLYTEDPATDPVPDAHIAATVNEFSRRPEKGEITVFTADGAVAGYAILVRFWSNEAGGDIVHIDELFVDAPFRGRGIASDFLKSLIRRGGELGRRLALEVTPKNDRALALYERIGFRIAKNRHLRMTI